MRKVVKSPKGWIKQDVQRIESPFEKRKCLLKRYVQDGKTWSNPDVYMENTWATKIHTQLLAKDKRIYDTLHSQLRYIQIEILRYTHSY